MVTTTFYTADSRYRTAAGEGFDGVVRVSFGGFYASGALLFDGRAVLTAAHLFAGRTGTASVHVETAAGSQTLSTRKVLEHAGYDAQGNNDLALVWLSKAAPLTVERYSLYRKSDEIGQAFTFAGYGKTGTGAQGVTSSGESSPVRLKAANQFDAEGAALRTAIGASMTWSPTLGSQLVADFDNGIRENDALGRLMSLYDLGRGLDEGLIAQGDSGGPAFLSGQLAGVASYTTRLARGSVEPDIDDVSNSSFGEIAAWQRVTYHQQWIDQALRASYVNAPTQRSEVKKEVTEGSSSTSHAYFLVEFSGVRVSATQVVSVDYATRDGTALAGSDYIAVSGTLNIYSDEKQAVIAVEVIGDTQPEPPESFYLEIFNPVGGSFGPGVVKLTGMKTIIDDDGFF